MRTGAPSNAYWWSNPRVFDFPSHHILNLVDAKIVATGSYTSPLDLTLATCSAMYGNVVVHFTRSRIRLKVGGLLWQSQSA
jgi:hypothetical protein